MRLSICTLARNENVYLNDWIKYHLDIGFDYIFIYDNGFIDDKSLSLSINNKYHDFVTIIDFRYIQYDNMIPNSDVYNDFIKHHFNYDWCAFIDIDEYIVLENYKSIKDFLKNIPRKFDAVMLNWHVIGDDNIIEGDEKINVFNRLFNNTNKYFQYFKTILRNRNKENIFSQNPHSFNDIKYCDCNFNHVEHYGYKSDSFSKDKKYSCYINHYMTKTLSEFIKYKYSRWKSGSVESNPFEYYFSINKKTPEKIAYIKEKLNIDIQ